MTYSTGLVTRLPRITTAELFSTLSDEDWLNPSRYISVPSPPAILNALPITANTEPHETLTADLKTRMALDDVVMVRNTLPLSTTAESLLITSSFIATHDGLSRSKPGRGISRVSVKRFPLIVMFVCGGNTPSGLSSASLNVLPVMTMLRDLTAACALPNSNSTAPSLHVHPSNVTFATSPVIPPISTVRLMPPPLNVTLR
ncbi:hypothetical protein ECC02_009460 [Trypanosoma cruzi]|uniref:Uncharacterized protein n=1 Tax=Trypanosoma cruzi TaxID=5693 RepID=A0A7J6XSY8_TRYCR|nr:hypothetical protein ECC02_009460 [Trypanosoma cruzi]